MNKFFMLISRHKRVNNYKRGIFVILISDCIKNNLDEGCIKVASTIAKKLKNNGATVVAANCDCSFADYKLSTNKLLTDNSIYDAISESDGEILYIPFASNTVGSAVRTYILAKKSRRKVNVLFTLRWDMNFLTKWLLKASGCRVITISQESYEYFKSQMPYINVYNVRVGVDTTKFEPVSSEKKNKLKQKYGFPLNKTIALHVGHLKHGRNIDVFLGLDDSTYGVLVFSAVTEKDLELKKQLEEKSNIRIIEDYIANIEEIYQAADVYVFPIVAENNSIDVPLSVLEAAACNCKIITTNYKEIACFDDAEGFYRVSNSEINDLQKIIKIVSQEPNAHTSVIAKKYDWSKAMEDLQIIIK